MLDHEAASASSARIGEQHRQSGELERCRDANGQDVVKGTMDGQVMVIGDERE